MKHAWFLNIFFALFLLQLNACGGGGGGGSSSSPAQGSVRASPSSIDSGDTTTVTVDIREVDQTFILKVRYPSGLSFVQSSAMMELSDTDGIFSHSPAEFNSDESTYLIFFLNPNQFSSDGRGKLSFNLIGDETTSGQIGIDMDVENPDVDNSFEFSVANPNFTLISDTSIRVTD